MKRSNRASAVYWLPGTLLYPWRKVKKALEDRRGEVDDCMEQTFSRMKMRIERDDPKEKESYLELQKLFKEKKAMESKEKTAKKTKADRKKKSGDC